MHTHTHTHTRKSKALSFFRFASSEKSMEELDRRILPLVKSEGERRLQCANYDEKKGKSMIAQYLGGNARIAGFAPSHWVCRWLQGAHTLLQNEHEQLKDAGLDFDSAVNLSIYVTLKLSLRVFSFM